MLHRYVGLTSAVGSILLISSCNVDQGLIAPQGPALTIVGGSSKQHIEVCKLGPMGSNADFTVSHTGTGTLPSGSSFTLPANPSECILGVNASVAWEIGAQTDPPDAVTVTETGATPGVYLYRIYTEGGLDGLQNIFAPPNYITVRADYTTSFVIAFKNQGTPTENGGQGCTPGYWKQPQHFDSWPSPYLPTAAFSSVFANAFPGLSLVQVLELGGGGLNALGRHAVAALLSAASDPVNYNLTPAEVITMFNAAFGSGNYEATKNVFAGYNEQVCPLN
jgi:hypothetical protein